MEPLSVVEYRSRHLDVFGAVFRKTSGIIGTGSRTIWSLNWTGKALLCMIGGVVLYVSSKFLSRRISKKSNGDPSCFRSAAATTRKAKRMSLGGGHKGSSATSHHNWAELQKAATGVTGTTDRDSIASGATLVDGTPLTPQQLGLMGMEALETVVGYWEDALAAYNPSGLRRNGGLKVLTGPEEAEFTKMLENILEGAYRLQDQAEHMFIHEHSILNCHNHLFEPATGASPHGLEVASGMPEGQTPVEVRHQLLSVSTVDQESFVSAQDTIADLGDFEDVDVEVMLGVQHQLDKEQLYIQALDHLETNGIPYRAIRADFVGCTSDNEYLAKLHCLRLAFRLIMAQEEHRQWWANSGRWILSLLMIRSDKDPKDFVVAYDEMLEYLNGPDSNMDQMMEELRSRNVQCANFFDIVFDYILIDSFEDLEAPPSSVVAVMNNRWLSNSFKETALYTAIWSVIMAKRRLLKNPAGFKAMFYAISEALLPCLAWGFLGPDEHLKWFMIFFKDQVLSFVRDMFSFHHVRYTSVGSLAEDIMCMAKVKVEATVRKAGLDVEVDL